MATGPGSINADGYHVGGTETLAKGTASDSAIFSLGQPPSRTIIGGAISFVASYMIIAAEGGTAGELLVIREAADGHDVTVKDDMGIKCGADRVLANNLSLSSFASAIASGPAQAEAGVPNRGQPTGCPAVCPPRRA